MNPGRVEELLLGSAGGRAAGAPFFGLAYMASRCAGRVIVFFLLAWLFFFSSFFCPILPLMEGNLSPTPKTSTQTARACRLVSKAEEDATLGAW